MWVGAYATILSGVTIGDGAVVGAAAVVAKDVPPYAVVVGNPARVARHRFDPATVAALLAVRWWDWPDEKVAAADLLYSPRVADFLARYGVSVRRLGLSDGVRDPRRGVYDGRHRSGRRSDTSAFGGRAGRWVNRSHR